MVGGHEKQNNSNTTAMLSSASCVSADWDCTPPLQHVGVDPQYNGVIEEQKWKIKHLQEQLTQFNCFWYRTLPANAIKMKNVFWALKKVSLTPMKDKSANSKQLLLMCGNPYGQESRCYQRIGVNGGMIKKVCVRWYWKRLRYLWVWMESHTGR
jgi:hypothetical protein